MGALNHVELLALCAASLGGRGLAQSTTCASVDSAEVLGDWISLNPSISADGRFVAFESLSTNLVTGDTNGVYDVFVRDLVNGTTERVSVDSAGLDGNGESRFPSISADGHFVAFQSLASDLVANDTNGFADVFVRDLLGGVTERVSVGTGGTEGNGASVVPSISGDGRCVAFMSYATSFSAGAGAAPPDVFVRDRISGTTERVSVSSSGAAANGPNGSGGPDSTPSISADSRFVVFVSAATNLVTGDTNGVLDVFLRDRLNASTERVSLYGAGLEGNGYSLQPTISDDGRYVAFESYASNLVAGDANGTDDIFVRDRQGLTTERVSVDIFGTDANSISLHASISADGRFVAFDSVASDLVAGDSNGHADIFLRDLRAGWTALISVGSPWVQGNGNSGGTSNLMQGPALSDDGRYVAFLSSASNFFPGDSNATWDVFVRDQGPPAPVGFCFGDGSAGSCPCGNTGASGRGCENSASTGGALLDSAGQASLAADTLHLTSSSELPTALSIVLQGDVAIPATTFGDGLRCVGGTLKRLYVDNASGGLVIEPQAGDPSISARSAALGDSISAGSTRCYQVYYRDPVLAFCANPPGNSWNVSGGKSVVWGQ